MTPTQAHLRRTSRTRSARRLAASLGALSLTGLAVGWRAGR